MQLSTSKYGENMKKIYLILTIIILIGAYFGFNKKEEEIVKIGFVGALTAKYSDLGNPMMNGIILAFEEENYKINGKKIELIFKDDKRDEEVNKKIVNDFINQGIKIVIGNVTSSMSKISMSIINNYPDMFMISAASASNEFSGIDDQFFRVHVANNAQRFDTFTKYVIKNNYKKIYGIYDPGNITYTKDYLENFEKSFISNGGEKFIQYSKTDEDLDTLVSEINTLNPDLILICANSVDASRVVQYLKMKDVKTQIASSEWAMTPAFIENTGRYSEGIIFNIDYDENSKSESFLRFSKKFREKYNLEPSLYASKGYELARIIIELLKVGDQTELKKNLLKIKEFKGLQDTIIFDEYGDVVREFNTFKVIDGKFEKVK
jgi:branched-chain amino acid transport system substrate-binding protein